MSDAMTATMWVRRVWCSLPAVRRPNGPYSSANKLTTVREAVFVTDRDDRLHEIPCGATLVIYDEPYAGGTLRTIAAAIQSDGARVCIKSDGRVRHLPAPRGRA